MVCLLVNSCGNLLQQLAVGLTYEQKMRGIYIVGGLTDKNIGSVVAQIDLFDPVDARWFPAVTSVPIPVSFAGVASCKGKIYVIGGFDSSGTCCQSTQIYDVATDTWSTGNPIGGTHASINAASVYDKICFAGGTMANANSASYSRDNHIYILDTNSGTWSTVTTTTYYYADYACVTLNNTFYTVGGRQNYAQLCQYFQGYIPFLDLYTPMAENSLPTTPYEGTLGITGVLYAPPSSDPLIILIGGYNAISGVSADSNFIFNRSGFNLTATTDVNYLVFPFTTTPWQDGTNYPQALGYASAAIYNDTILCFGGTNGVDASFEVYNSVYSIDASNIATASWTAEIAMPVARFGHTALTIKQ